MDFLLKGGVRLIRKQLLQGQNNRTPIKKQKHLRSLKQRVSPSLYVLQGWRKEILIVRPCVCGCGHILVLVRVVCALVCNVLMWLGCASIVYNVLCVLVCGVRWCVVCAVVLCWFIMCSGVLCV